MVTALGRSEQVQVCGEWVGGTQTTGTLIRPVARLEQLSSYPELCARIRTLVGEGLRAEAIADHLNAEGYRPPKRRERFGRQGVLARLPHLGVREQRTHGMHRDALDTHEWWVPTLARRIGMPEVTLHNWIRRRWVRARQLEAPDRRWIVWADAAELERLQQLHQRPAGYYTRRQWVEDVDLPAEEVGASNGGTGDPEGTEEARTGSVG